jgi:putative addiction module component (TIGR02574 family)
MVLLSIAGPKSMSARLKSLGIDQLVLEERLALVEEIWDSIGEAQPISLTEAQRPELELRCAEDDANPDDVTEWEQVRASTLLRLGK